MEFLKSISKRRTLLSEIIYIALNIGLAIMLMLVVRYTNSLVPAIIIVILSQWRVFAVRARFWVANIQANALLFIVSLSYVIFLFSFNPSQTDVSGVPSLIIQSILVVFYTAWLTLLKPKSKRHFVAMQSGVALFVGITALFMVSYGWIAAPVVILSWLISYVSARHILATYDEGHDVLISLAFSLAVAEVCWLAFHWAIAYQLPFLSEILIPQASIIVMAIGFMGYKSYDSFYHNQKVKVNEIILPLVFSIALVGVLVLFRNGIDQFIF